MFKILKRLGPGCSSMDGLFLEVGPFRVQKNGTLAMIQHHWAQLTNVLFGNFFFFPKTLKLINPLELDIAIPTMEHA